MPEGQSEGKVQGDSDALGSLSAGSSETSFATPTIETNLATTGTIIGPYHLLDPIGEGGMGEVWLAEQTEPVRRRVALKVIKPGMDTREVVARFEAERQALALMDHPDIAKVFDAGRHRTGRPYFVMEYVEGDADHRRTATSTELTHARAAGAVHPGLRGRAARAPEGRSSTATSSRRTSW